MFKMEYIRSGGILQYDHNFWIAQGTKSKEHLFLGIPNV